MAKGAVKLHTQYDVRTSIPVFMHVSAASIHDVNAMDQITYEPGSFYIFDRGYLDFERLYLIHQSKSFFVIREKNNLKFKRVYSSPVDQLRCMLRSNRTSKRILFLTRVSGKNQTDKIL